MEKYNLGNRVKQRREELSLSVRQLASMVGVSNVSLGRMEKINAKSSRFTPQLAKALGVRVEWLLTGEGQMTDSNKAFSVPLISASTATNFTSIVDLGTKDILQYFPSMIDFKDKGFALKIDGDSMTAPVGRSYPDGAFAIFDAGNKKPNSNDLVLAKIKGREEVTFKKFVSDAGQSYLMPLNPSYPRIDDEFTVIAVFQYAIVY